MFFLSRYTMNWASVAPAGSRRSLGTSPLLYITAHSSTITVAGTVWYRIGQIGCFGSLRFIGIPSAMFAHPRLTCVIAFGTYVYLMHRYGL